MQESFIRAPPVGGCTSVGVSIKIWKGEEAGDGFRKRKGFAY